MLHHSYNVLNRTRLTRVSQRDTGLFLSGRGRQLRRLHREDESGNRGRRRDEERAEVQQVRQVDAEWGGDLVVSGRGLHGGSSKLTFRQFVCYCRGSFCLLQMTEYRCARVVLAPFALPGEFPRVCAARAGVPKSAKIAFMPHLTCCGVTGRCLFSHG